MHDLGHGAFSHVLDILLAHTKKSDNYAISFNHEERSCVLFKHLVTTYGIPLSADDIRFICNLIDPPPDCTGYLYQL